MGPPSQDFWDSGVRIRNESPVTANFCSDPEFPCLRVPPNHCGYYPPNPANFHSVFDSSFAILVSSSAILFSFFMLFFSTKSKFAKATKTRMKRIISMPLSQIGFRIGHTLFFSANQISLKSKTIKLKHNNTVPGTPRGMAAGAPRRLPGTRLRRLSRPTELMGLGGEVAGRPARARQRVAGMGLDCWLARRRGLVAALTSRAMTHCNHPTSSKCHSLPSPELPLARRARRARTAPWVRDPARVAAPPAPRRSPGARRRGCRRPRARGGRAGRAPGGRRRP